MEEQDAVGLPPPTCFVFEQEKVLSLFQMFVLLTHVVEPFVTNQDKTEEIIRSLLFCAHFCCFQRGKWSENEEVKNTYLSGDSL